MMFYVHGQTKSLLCRFFKVKSPTVITSTAVHFRRRSTTTSDHNQLFAHLEPHELTPKRKYPLAGLKYLPDSHAKGFPEFLEAPRKDLPHVLMVKNADQFTVSEWAQQCRKVLDEKLTKYGAVLFRGLPLTEEKHFASLTDSLGYTPMDYTGGTGNRPVVDAKSRTYISTLDPKEITIEPHNEMASSSFYPHKMVLFSQRAVEEGCGGLTPITRNSEALSKLDPKVVQKFEEKQLRYLRYLPSKADDIPYASWQSSFYTDNKKDVENYLEKVEYSYKWNDDDSLNYWYNLPAVRFHPVTGEKVWFNQAGAYHISFTKALPMFDGVTFDHEHLYPTHSTYGDGTEIEPEVLQHIRITNWECAVGFEWQKSDLMVLDNLAVMHARLSYTGNRKTMLYMSAD